MAAAYNKFNSFVDSLAKAIINLNTDTLNCALTNSAPSSSNTILSDITQIANGNGYSTGGSSAGASYAYATGTVTMTGTNIVWTSSGAGMAAFRYVVLYDVTPTSPLKPLIAWWDYGSSLTLAVGETFTIQFNSGVSSGTMFTIS